MHRIVIIKNILKPNQKNVMKMRKKGYDNKLEIVTETFLKKKKSKKRLLKKQNKNMYEENIQKLKKYGKRYRSARKTLL